MTTTQFNPKTGGWEPAIPAPYYYTLFPWAPGNWLARYVRAESSIDARVGVTPIQA